MDRARPQSFTFASLPISKVDLNYNQIGDAGAAELAKAIAANCTLTDVCHARAAAGKVAMACWVLCMMSVSLSENVLDDALSFVTRPVFHSTKLNLYYNKICDGGVEELATVLAANHTLTRVCCARHVGNLSRS